MSLLWWIILFCLLGGVLSVLAAALFLLAPERMRSNALPHFVSFAIGALLGAAFLALLPHAVEGPHAVDFHEIGLAVLADERAEEFARGSPNRGRWMSRLTEEARTHILGIKEVVCGLPEYRREMLSVHIYEAVLDCGVCGIEEFKRWWRARK